MNLRHAHNIFDGISQILQDVDPRGIRLISDRVLIRDVADQEQEQINGVVIPEVSREKTAAGKDGRLRLGVVVAVGPGDRFLELGLDAHGDLRRKLITCRCSCTEDRTPRRYFDIREYRFIELDHSQKCPACGGEGRIPVVVPPQCNPGDTVLYDRRREAEFNIDGVRYSLVHAEQSVFAVIEKE